MAYLRHFPHGTHATSRRGTYAASPPYKTASPPHAFCMLFGSAFFLPRVKIDNLMKNFRGFLIRWLNLYI